MSSKASGNKPGVKSFRTKLLFAMMLVVATMTCLGLFLAQRKVAIEAELDLLQDFQNELATLYGMQEVRRAALVERCRVLVLRPRIHAALEDNALDLLYPSAKDELREIVDPNSDGTPETPGAPLNARFYRFLDRNGAVITPPEGTTAGNLRPAEEAQLALPSAPSRQQIGYLLRDASGTDQALDEVLAMPIVSTVTGEVIAALVFGFKPIEFARNRPETDIKSGIWLKGRLHLPALTESEQLTLGTQVSSALAMRSSENRFEVTIGGAPHLVFYKQLNPGSLFSPVYEVAVYPLANALARQRQIRSHVIIAGALLLLVGLIASHFISQRLSRPVERLAVTSEKNRAQWQLAEAALESTSEELQRSARFSADASHQLKTPVTVLRAGIEELLGREGFTPDVYDELSALLHHTYRITGVIDDLLLLSRMDAGRLKITFDSVNLSKLLEEWIDDMSALPDDFHLKLETDFPPGLRVAGEKGYITLIVQNLLENARKYNIAGGKICIWAREQGEIVMLSIENTGRPIPAAARSHIFERFHRGGVGENVPGHGLGLNLARELARLHGGDLRLIRSDNEGTEFQVRFRVARQPAATPAHSAA